MANITEIGKYLEEIAPHMLAEPWDNVGLLVGDPRSEVQKAMTCLTISPDTAAEAIDGGAQLIVTHHPLPFTPLKRLTTETPTGRILLDLIAARVAVYSAHTAWDSAAQGINQALAEGLKLQSIQPLVPHPSGLGAGRYGSLSDPTTLEDIAERVRALLNVDRLQIVGSKASAVRTIGIACGAAGELLSAARAVGCDTFLLGETRFHTCIEAESTGVNLILPGHYASERFSMELLADQLQQQFPKVKTWASRNERDPLQWI